MLVVPATLLLSCSSSDKDATSDSPGENPRLARPDTTNTEISIEGATEKMQLFLMKSPDEFPLSFSTYIPIDMKVARMREEGGLVLRIMAAFGGRPNKEAQLTIGAFARGIQSNTVHTRVLKKARSIASLSEDPARYPWAQTVYSLQGDRSGFLALAEKNSRWFYLLASYPPEYADGMGPRINKVIEQWRWQDNGKPLDG